MLNKSTEKSKRTNISERNHYKDEYYREIHSNEDFDLFENESEKRDEFFDSELADDESFYDSEEYDGWNS